jgi:hypothetical protein
MSRELNNTPPNTRRPEPRRDVGKEIDQAIPSPDVARRAAEDIEEHASEKRSGDPSLHERVFGEDDEAMVDDTPPGAGRREVNQIGTAVQPEEFQPMRGVGDTDQGDRQPDGGRRR